MTGNSRRWLPTAVVVLAVAAMGVAARRTGGMDAGPSDGLWKDLRPLAAVLVVVVLLVVVSRYARHRDDEYGLLHRAGTATGVLLAIAAVLTPVGLILLGRQPSRKAPTEVIEQVSTTSTVSASKSASRLKHAAPAQDSRWIGFVARSVLLLIVAAVIVLIVYGIVRLLRGRLSIGSATPVLEFDALDADLEQLAEAVAAGSDALAYEGDAREAVIACYAAMEDALGSGGNGRRDTDTPEEFLTRITGAKLIPAGPAQRLTELFREARFSRHPIAEPKREQAREALSAIAEHLRARAVEAQAAAEARIAAARGAAAGAEPAAPGAGGRR